VSPLKGNTVDTHGAPHRAEQAPYRTAQHRVTMEVERPLKIAVIGSGCTGLAAAYALHKSGHSVKVFEKDSHVGGHAHTQYIGDVPVDTGFMVCNHVTYPTMLQWFENEGVTIQESDMSLSVSLEGGKWEWGSEGLSGLFACKSNAASPAFLRMLREMTTFKADAEAFLADPPADKNAMSLGAFLRERRYSDYFVERYLVPACASIWSVPATRVVDSPAYFILEFMANHHMLQVFNRPQWYTVAGRSAEGYVAKVTASFAEQIVTNAEVIAVTKSGSGLRLKVREAKSKVKVGTASAAASAVKSALSTATSTVTSAVSAVVSPSREKGGATSVDLAAMEEHDETFDHVIFACHAPDALSILGDAATTSQAEWLSAFEYQTSQLYLHQDPALMPTRKTCWSAWNFLGTDDERGVAVTYYLNKLQSLAKEHPTVGDVFVTLNPAAPPETSAIVSEWRTSHPVPSSEARRAAARAADVQGENHVWFAGAYLGYGFHEDGTKAGFQAAHSLLSSIGDASPRKFPLPVHRAHAAVAAGVAKSAAAAAPSAPETSSLVQSRPGPLMRLVASGASVALGVAHRLLRTVVIKFLRSFIIDGCLKLQEPSGDALLIGDASSPHRATIIVKRDDFFRRVALRADLGLSEAYFNYDFDTPEVRDILEVCALNRHRIVKQGASMRLFQGMSTAVLGSAMAYWTHLSQHNKVGNTATNIGNHYDLSNDMFATFLSDDMTYSCAYWKHPGESLQQAQHNKLDLLISKLKLTKDHTVLEIGFGWGSLSIRIAQTVGCKVVGLTLSREQKALAEERVAAAGVGHLIEYHYTDYRTFHHTSGGRTFDRVVSCEMLEAVGHEYLPDFYKAVDELMKPHGICVVQVITTPDDRYEDYRHSAEFINIHIFPGACCPSFGALTAAATAASTLTVEAVQNIGPHYVPTLAQWRRNFLANKDKLLALGFDDIFIRKWDYYFHYCEVGFKLRVLGDLQIVYSKAANLDLSDDIETELCDKSRGLEHFIETNGV